MKFDFVRIESRYDYSVFFENNKYFAAGEYGYGLPCGISKVYAMPWQVGEAGLTFDPKSVDEIADTLEELWLDDDLCKVIIVYRLILSGLKVLIKL